MNVAGGELDWVAVLNDSQFQASLNRMDRNVNRTSTNIQNQGNQIESFAKKAGAAAAAFFSVQAAEGFVSSLVSVRNQFQQLEIAFSTMLRSKAKADTLMKELIVFAGTTPFGLKDAAGAAKQLLAYGSTAKTVVGELRMLGDVASGVSVPIGELVYLYGTLKTQGRAYAMDIRQFAGRGIPIYAELAKVLKINKDEVAGFVEAGKVGFPQVEQAFKNMTASGGMFGGLMEAQSKSLGGLIERFKDAWDIMLNDMGKSNEGFIGNTITGATEMIESYQKVLDIITVLIATYGIYKAAVVTTAAFEKVSAASKFGLAIAVNQESVARIANAQALSTEMRAEVSNLAAKKASATQAAVNAVQSAASAAASLKEAQAKISNAASNNIVSAQEKAGIARKAALTASSQFYTAQQRLETLSKTESSAAELNHLRAQVSNLAVKKTAAIQSAVNAAANVKVVQSKVLEASTEKVLAAQERVAITRKAALTASSQFYAAQQRLETTAKVANSAATVELTVVESLNAASKRLLTQATAAYNAVLVASPVYAFTAVLTSLGAVIYSLTQITDAAEISQKALADSHEEGGKTSDSQKRKVEELINVIKDHTSTVDQQKAAYDKLQETTGGILKSYSMEDIAANKAINTIDDYILKIKEAAAARKAYSEFTELADKMDELERKGISSIGTWTKLGRSIQNTFTPSSKGIGLGDWAYELIDGKAASDRIVKQEKDVLNTSMEALKKEFGGKFNEIISGASDTSDTTTVSKTKNKAFYDAIVKKNTDDLEALDSAARDFQLKAAPIKKNIEEAKAKLLQFDITGKANKQSDKQNKEENSAIKRQAEMLQKIYQLNEKYNDKSLTDDEQKLAQIRGEFKALQDDIDIYNKDSRNKKVNPNLKPQLEKAIENKEYEIETERIKTSLEKQKAIYTDYEEYKTQVGEAAATARYENEIDTSRTFLEKLKEEAKALEKDPLTMTGPQTERLKYLYAQINEGEQVQKQAYQEAYVAAMSHEQQISIIRQKYVEFAKELSSSLTESQKAELIRQQSDEIEAANETAFQKTAIYKKLAEQTVLYTKEALKAEIKAAQNILKDSGLSPALRSDVEKHLEELNKALDLGVNKSNSGALDQRKKFLEAALIDPLNAGTEQAKEYRAELIKVQTQIDAMGGGSGKTVDMFKGSTSDVAGNIAGGLGQLTGAFGELSSSLEGVNDGLAYTLGSIGELMKVGEDAAGAVASFATGDIIGGVTKTISAVAGLFRMGKKVKEMNAAARKEVADYYEAAIDGEREYQALLRKRELDEVARGKTSYQALIAQLELLKKQSPEIKAAYDKIYASIQGQEYVSGMDSKHGTWFRKAKTWDIMASLGGSDYDELEKLYTEGKLKDQAKKDFEALRTLREELKAAGLDVEDLQDQLNEMLTGTSVEGLSDALSDLFENGKLSAADFGDTFENIMRKAILNSFKLNVIQTAMAPVFDMLSGMFENGKMPGEKEISDWLSFAASVGDGLGGQFSLINEMLEKLGMGPKETTSTNSLTGAYATASQESINLLTGQTAGMRLAQLETNALLNPIGKTSLELLKVGTAKLDALVKIEINTGKTANNTNRLERIESALISIDKKIGANAAALAANGRLG